MKINSTREGINSRIIDSEKQISDLEGTMMKITAIEQNIEKRVKKKNEDILGDLWDKLNVPTFTL